MNIAIINQGGSRYLFGVPENISLKEGERVKCDTRRGVTDGIVWADSLHTDEPTAKLIGRLTGARFPLRSVTGRMEYAPFERVGSKPTEDKPKFKVGEWVYITKSHAKRAVNGEIYEVAPYEIGSGLFIKHPDGKRISDGAANICYSEYLVLDGYHPEAEKEPEYYSSKVVCVESCDGFFTAGKIYEFVNGKVADNDKDQRPCPLHPAEGNVESLDEWNSIYGCDVATFIEFKGEAHADA